MKIVVGVGGQEMEGPIREGNDANLPASKSSFRCSSRDEETGHVRKPGRLVIETILGNGYLLRGSAGNIHGEESADILGSGLHDRNHDSLAVGGPGKGQIIRVKLFVMEKIAFECAIAPSDFEVSNVRITMLMQVGKALAIGRKRDGAIHVLDKQARSSPKHGSVVQGSNGLLGVLAADEVNVIAVGRKGEAAVTRGGGCDHLGVASRGNMPKPEGLQAILLLDVEQVFPIGGDSGEENVTVIGEIFDRHAFDGKSFLVRQEGINTEGRGGDKQEYD